MEIKLELFSPEIVSALENEELLSHFRVYRKIATSAPTDRWITTDGRLHEAAIQQFTVNEQN